jgi:ADP-ribose pyrophosphatase YjhB (NUDIX family)
MSENPKTQRVAVAAFALRSDGKFLVGERSSEENFLPGHIELIGGGTKWGEDPSKALIREVKEESVLDITVDVPLMTITYMMGDVHRVMIVFLCRIVGNEVPVASSEHSRLFYTSESEITDHPTDDFMQRVVRESISHAKRLDINVAT